MQRWIAIGLVVVLLAVGGAGYGLHLYKQSRPHPVWVPMPINRELTEENGREIAKDLKAKLGDKARLTLVSQELGLAKLWELPSDDAAASEISERLFVDLGEMDTPTGKVPSINIGVRGPVKDKQISEKLAMRLMQDVRKLLGIKPPLAKAKLE